MTVSGVSPPAGLEAELLRLENRLRDSVEPRLDGVRFKRIPLASGAEVLVLRVPASLAGPHRSSFKGTKRFYARSSAGKYEMDMDQLRAAFAAGEELPRRFRRLHAEAVERSEGQNMPFRVAGGPVAIVTVAPASLFRERRDLRFEHGHSAMPALRSDGLYDFRSLEGFVLHSSVSSDGVVRTYALNHRAGWIESAWRFGRPLTAEDGFNGPSPPPIRVWRANFEPEVDSFVRQATGVLLAHDVLGPYTIQVSVRSAKGAKLLTGDSYEIGPVWRDSAYLGDVVFDVPPGADLSSIFDNYWLLFGRERPGDSRPR